MVSRGARIRFGRWVWLAVLATLAAAGTTWFLAQPERVPPAVWAAQRTASPDALSIMTFNISRGGFPRMSALDAIESASPDIVCMQELTGALAAAFEERFGKTYPYRVFAPGPSVHGIGLASRIPVSRREIIRDGMSFLPAAAGSVSFDGEEIRILCLHLIPPHARIGGFGDAWQGYQRNRETRLAQARIAVGKLAAHGRPAVILGDMNEISGQAALGLLRDEGFVDACDMSGAECAATWPGALLSLPAMVRIDHIVGRGVRFADSAVLDAAGSDHYPMATRITGAGKPLESNASSD